jgi:hypothetical protein
MPGHCRPECLEVHQQRNLILTHTPLQRLELIRALGRLGFGLGAMFRGKEYYNDGEFIGTVCNFDFVTACNFVESKNMRYSKKVRLNTLCVEKDYIYRRIYMRYLHMSGGTTSERNLSISVTQALLDAANAPERDAYRQAYAQDIQLFAPSNDIEFDEEILIRDICMPKRLLLGKENTYMKGIMPTITL